MPTVTVEVSEATLELLGKAGKGDAASYVHDILEREGRRLYHVERCKPRPQGAPGSKGRATEKPALSGEIRELAEKLRTVWASRRAGIGDELFDAVYGRRVDELERAIAGKDAGTLERMWRDKEWIR